MAAVLRGQSAAVRRLLEEEPPSPQSRRARPEVSQASGAAVRRPASALGSPEL